MKTGKDGRARIQLRDIDLRGGISAYRWFWFGYIGLVVLWLIS